MMKTKEELQKELENLKNMRKEVLIGAKGQECEVYSRIVGYYRSISNYNRGRAQEFKDRKNYKI